MPRGNGSRLRAKLRRQEQRHQPPARKFQGETRGDVLARLLAQATRREIERAQAAKEA